LAVDRSMTSWTIQKIQFPALFFAGIVFDTPFSEMTISFSPDALSGIVVDHLTRVE